MSERAESFVFRFESSLAFGKTPGLELLQTPGQPKVKPHLLYRDENRLLGSRTFAGLLCQGWLHSILAAIT